MELRAPFPWTGGKYWVANKVWEALGDVHHYIEPFGGSMAVLLARPHKARLETVNDLNHYLINFWRALKADASVVAYHTENPISEADLYARNKTLIETSEEFKTKILDDPEFFDPKLAGWWVWGQSTIIGRTFANDVCKKMPSLLPAGVNGRNSELQSWLQALAVRMRGVRILCGDWKRCLGPTSLGLSPKSRFSSVGVFLDPPYVDGDYKYANSVVAGDVVWDDARSWAIEHGQHRHMRIILAGYEDGREMPESWIRLNWKGHGGLGRKSRGNNENRHREVLWMSPHCLQETGFHDLMDLVGG